MLEGGFSNAFYILSVANRAPCTGRRQKTTYQNKNGARCRPCSVFSLCSRPCVLGVALALRRTTPGAEHLDNPHPNKSDYMELPTRVLSPSGDVREFLRTRTRKLSREPAARKGGTLVVLFCNPSQHRSNHYNVTRHLDCLTPTPRHPAPARPHRLPSCSSCT